MYKIIGFDEKTGQAIISVNNDTMQFSIDVPLDNNGLFFVGEELDNYIKGFIPVDLIDRKNILESGVANAHEIYSLVEILPNEKNQQTDEMWQQTYLEKQIAKALVKFGVLQTNPTEIPVNTL